MAVLLPHPDPTAIRDVMLNIPVRLGGVTVMPGRLSGRRSRGPLFYSAPYGDHGPR